MRNNFVNGLMFGTGILLVIVVGIAVAVAADILTVDKDGTIRLRVSDQGKVTLNASTTTEGDLRFTTRSSDPTAPLAGDLWYNDTTKLIKYTDGGMTKPLAETTNAALSLYVNGTTGNDNNNGLTSGTAVQTIQKAVNLVPPIVRHAVTINVAAGTYRDAGATNTNVYVANKFVASAEGSITFIGDETTPANVRVTGADSDPTPSRADGFLVSGVKNVYIRGFLCNYFTGSGIRYYGYALGNPTNCVSSNNNVSGITYDLFSRGYPNSCTTNSNAYGIFANTGSSVNPSSCTANSNTNVGVYCAYGSNMNPSNNSCSSNVYGILCNFNATMYASNNTSTANNTSYGIYADNGAMVRFGGTTPVGNTANTGASAVNFARCY